MKFCQFCAALDNSRGEVGNMDSFSFRYSYHYSIYFRIL